MAIYVKVAIDPLSDPELFEALAQLDNPRKRAARLRSLARAGLAGGNARAVAPSQGTLKSVLSPVASAIAGSAGVAPTMTVEQMLDWEGDETA